MGTESELSPELQAAREEAMKQYREAFQPFKHAAEQWVAAMLSQKNPALRIQALEKVESAEEEVNRREEELLKLGMSMVDTADLRRQLAAEK